MVARRVHCCEVASYCGHFEPDTSRNNFFISKYNKQDLVENQCKPKNPVKHIELCCVE